MKISISVIVTGRNEGAWLLRTIENMLDTVPSGTEVLLVDDASDDGSTDAVRDLPRLRIVRACGLGVAQSRNFGAQQSSGDILVFIDAHMQMGPGWLMPLVDVLESDDIGAAAPAVADMERPNSVGYGLSFAAPDLSVEWLSRRRYEPYAVPILPGCCLAMRREVFKATAGFDAGLRQSGSVDNELSVRFWLLGYELRLIPGVTVRHLFRDRFPYDVQWQTQLRNRLRLAYVHFSTERLARVLNATRTYSGFADALSTVTMDPETDRWREWLQEKRVRTDDWLFERFCIDW